MAIKERKQTEADINKLQNTVKKRNSNRKISLNPRNLTRMEEETAKLINKSLQENLENIEEGIDFQTVEEPETNFSSTTATNDAEEGQLSVDIYENDNEIHIVAAIAGVKKENIRLAITSDVLYIKGKREKPYSTPLKECITQECFWGTFSRSIVLPEDIDKGNIKAEFKDGILKIKIPKSEKIRTKIITIK